MEKHQVLTVLVADDEPELLGAVCGKISCKTFPLTRTSGSFTRRASFPRPT